MSLDMGRGRSWRFDSTFINRHSPLIHLSIAECITVQIRIQRDLVFHVTSSTNRGRLERKRR